MAINERKPDPWTHIHWRIGNNPPSRNTFDKPVNYGYRKPVGGIWTSIPLENWKGEGVAPPSHWINYCEKRHQLVRTTLRLWELVPIPNYKTFVIHEWADLHDLVLNYPDANRADTFIDFPAVGLDYDAIHLTEDGFKDCVIYTDESLNLTGWIPESTLWLKWKFVDIIDRGSYTVKDGA